MYGPGSSASPPPPGDSGEDLTSNPRYAYLVSRLRNRQITMEEATELFALQQRQVRALQVRTNQLVAAAAAAPPPPESPRLVPTVVPTPSPAARSAAPAASGDFLAEGILFASVGAGLLAALIKRAQAEPPGPSPSGAAPSPPPSPPAKAPSSGTASARRA